MVYKLFVTLSNDSVISFQKVTECTKNARRKSRINDTGIQDPENNNNLQSMGRHDIVIESMVINKLVEKKILII